MNSKATRRGPRTFLLTTVFLLVVAGRIELTSSAGESPAVSAEGKPFRIAVVTQAVSRDINGRAPSWIYITEVLQRAGLFFEQLTPAQIPSIGQRKNVVVVLAGDQRLTAANRAVLEQFVEAGGSLIGIGGTSGLDRLFGVVSKRPLAEGWMKVVVKDHPVTAGLRSSLHVFGGYAVTTDQATSLVDLESGRQGPKGAAIVENRIGEGRAILLAPDLLFSIVHIQQGTSVYQDAVAAPDDSAQLDDGELKAEDGLVLDWKRDRTPLQPDGVPVFLEPITDELREVILRSIFHLVRQQGGTLPMLWYWPRGLKAVGHISHDSDGNDPQKAVALLEVMNRCDVKSTWCMLYPGGYPREFYRTLIEQGFEVALHYDARTGGAQTSWSKENLVLQHQWLLDEARMESIASNKNHYTRWEGRLDFLRWCEDVGIESDQSRGPSKHGTIGFPLGGSQPYFALDDQVWPPRFLKVLQINLLTQDLVVVCPREYGRQLIDSVVRHHGVAHFLFHPAHIQKPDVAEALCQLVEYGRECGLEWWTSEQVCRWEKRRRRVTASFNAGQSMTLQVPEPVRGATLLFLKPGLVQQVINVNNRPAELEPCSVYGYDFEALQLDLDGEVTVGIRHSKRQIQSEVDNP